MPICTASAGESCAGTTCPQVRLRCMGPVLALLIGGSWADATGCLMSELYGQAWAMALCDELGLDSFRPGSFATAMVRAALAADSSNLAAIGQGFPELSTVVGEWRRYGHGYLVALAAGDVGGMTAAREACWERDIADHEQAMAALEILTRTRI